MAEKRKWVYNCGPSLLLSGEYLSYWEGSDPPSGGRTVEAVFRWNAENGTATDYDRACDINEYLGTIDVGQGRGLVLGDAPMMTTWLPTMSSTPDGMLIRWRYADDEGSVLAALFRIPDDIWEPEKFTFSICVTPLHLFGASYAGKAFHLGEHLIFSLPAGTYALATCEYKPDERTALVLHRFSRVS